MGMFGIPESSFWWAFPAFLIATFVFVPNVVARWSGWKRLADAYPERVEASGERFRWRSARFRAGCNYNNCINFVSGRSGLHLSMPFVFRVGHSPIQIPWDELSAHEETWFLMSIVVLTAARCPDTPIRIHRSLAQRLLSGGTQAAIQADPKMTRFVVPNARL